jgi:hypothetical protein
MRTTYGAPDIDYKGLVLVLIKRSRTWIAHKTCTSRRRPVNWQGGKRIIRVPERRKKTQSFNGRPSSANLGATSVEH